MTPERHRRITTVLDQRQPDLTVVLEGVHKPHNLSAIQRSCDAVGILDIHAIAPRRRYRAYKPMAAGSDKWIVPHNHPDVETALSALQQRGFRILAAHLSDKAVDYRSVDYTRPVAILMGTERYGVSPEALALTDAEITVPMHGMVASLNVSVAAAVILYEAQRQRQAAGMYEQPRLDPARRRELLFRWGYPVLAKRFDALGLPLPRLDDEGGLMDPIPDSVRRPL